ncbi:hypothetical protein [Campylobacter sp. CS_ED2]|nr:hypothetical protein [Campylobacter sp. CS_ED2]
MTIRPEFKFARICHCEFLKWCEFALFVIERLPRYYFAVPCKV